MINNNNKILTVSYGTFSCTLEGFDDSFGTMKAIAEYFRNLAADDRYFGAEPPQPDAEMLARIAQKEISRRVEAREHDGKIVLSAMQDQAVAPKTLAAATAAAVSPAAQPVEEAAETAIADDTPAETADAASLPDDVLAKDALPETPEQTDAVAVEMPLEEPAQENPSEQVTSGEEIAVADNTESPSSYEAHDTSAAVSPASDEENDIVPDQPDADVEAFFAASATTGSHYADDQDDNDFAALAEPFTPVIPAAADSIAAKLQRIRAVVAQHDGDGDEYTFAEDLEDLQAPEGPADLMADALRDIEDALDADEANDAESAAAESLAEMTDEDDSDPANISAEDDNVEADIAEDDNDDITAILDRLERDTATDATQIHNEEGTDTLIADVEPDSDEDGPLENLFDGDDATAGDSVDTKSETAKSESEDLGTEIFEEASVQRSPMLKASDELLLEREAETTEDLTQSSGARVIKVKRADFEAAIESSEIEEYEDEAHAVALDDIAPAKQSTSSLSREEEDELVRELAELEADIKLDLQPAGTAQDTFILPEDMGVDEDLIALDDSADDADNTDAETDFEDTSKETADRDFSDAETSEETNDSSRQYSALPSIDGEQGTDMTRLMAEADHQMDEPESAVRRDAFAHLRAAVAAKKADDALGTSADKLSGDDAYRNDLADVVRPRRPVAGENRTPRPAEDRPAPLKLVAEQRIDVASATKSGTVRPRRVSTVTEVPSAEGESFADFAADMGATSLPQLLEAAAAYMAFVEGREQFSRPQLMTKVRQVGSQEGFSREDGLRTFGQLLRAGKIEKIKGGRFTVSEDIGFRPDHRAAG